jgi:hypothetical protein
MGTNKGKIMTREIKTALFAITEDHLDNEQLPKTEIDKLKKEGYTEYFRLYDDDEILYYSGYLKGDIEDDDDLFAPLDWGAYDSGCTIYKLRNRKTGKLEIL